MSHRYRYTGEVARSIPALGLEDVQPGDVVDVPVEMNHPDFKPVKESVKSTASEKPAASKEDA
jgi:hypothetical protein